VWLAWGFVAEHHHRWINWETRWCDLCGGHPPNWRYDAELLICQDHDRATRLLQLSQCDLCGFTVDGLGSPDAPRRRRRLMVGAAGVVAALGWVLLVSFHEPSGSLRHGAPVQMLLSGPDQAERPLIQRVTPAQPSRPGPRGMGPGALLFASPFDDSLPLPWTGPSGASATPQPSAPPSPKPSPKPSPTPEPSASPSPSPEPSPSPSPSPEPSPSPSPEPSPSP